MIGQFLKHLLRFLTLCAFAFWQGGFVFYSGVVVPLGSDMWGDRTQGFLTRMVAPWMNVAGGVALAIWILDGIFNPPWRKTRIFLAISMGIGVAVLVWLYPQMNTHLDPVTEFVEDPKGFKRLHRVYLWLCTVIWMVSLLWLWLLTSPRKQDERINEKGSRISTDPTP